MQNISFEWEKWLGKIQKFKRNLIKTKEINQMKIEILTAKIFGKKQK